MQSLVHANNREWMWLDRGMLDEEGNQINVD